MTNRIFMTAAAASLTALAVGCRPDEIETIYGEVGIVYTDAEGNTRTDREAVYDLGSVFMGQNKDAKIVVRNLDKGSLTLDRLEKLEGDATVINGAGDEAPVWTVEFTPGTSLASSEFVELNVNFKPPENPDVVQTDHVLKLMLRVQNAREDESTAIITLVGKGVSGVCELPKVLEFGKVQVEDSFRRTVEIRNPTQISAIASIGEIQSSSGDHNAFVFAPESPRGDVELPAGTNRNVVIDFLPTEKRSYLAFVRMKASAQCSEQVVQLAGNGVASVLKWAPDQVDCGFVTPGVEVTREITFTNEGNVDAQLSAIKTLNNTEFGVVAEDGVDPTKLLVPGNGGTAKLTVWCKPVSFGPRATNLTFSTNLPKQANGTVKLNAYGGGPDIEVQPSPTLNFGKVAYFADADPPVFQRKKLLVMNVGTAPNPPQAAANLRLGNVDASGNPVEPYFTVTPLNAQTAVDEFKVTMPAAYDPMQGLEAKVGKNTAELLVQVTPTSLGLKQAEITIYSNDPDEAEVKITVSADAVELPPCNYTVSPTTLAFGLISPPDYRDLGFTIKNNGTNPGDICLISSVAMGAGSDAYFSLPSGEIDSKELQPGDSMHVLVRVWPQGTTPTNVSTINGTVDFYASSPLKPQSTVSLTAQIAPSCLTIAPDELDYGTVQVGCSSATKTFSMYNTCGSPVLVNGFRILSAPAADPSCLASGSNCEFLLTNAPAIPTNGLPINAGSAPTTFQVKYKPQDFGPDTDAVAISATQNGTNVTYVVALKGLGDSQGIHTDVYLQDAKPKADILLVIDNSCSMSPHQQNLASNFASFIKYANAAAVDYHVGVTHVDPSITGYATLLYGPGHPEKVLTPTTVDVENKFKTKVNLGAIGGWENCAEPALMALTPPLVNSDNAGFLRHDAALAVVCVMDEQDQSPQSTSYYLNAFWNIKGFNRKTMFTFNAIASFDPSCPSTMDSGELAFYVSQTNGVKESLCTPDWSKALENLGKTAFGFRTNFFLTSAPDLTKGPIEVKIDGVTVPTTDARGAPIWSFDSVASSVNFEPMYVPEPGQTLTITYHVTCYP